MHFSLLLGGEEAGVMALLVRSWKGWHFDVCVCDLCVCVCVCYERVCFGLMLEINRQMDDRGS